MLRWLANQGQSFHQPIPGSTNYLSAYNAKGELYRAIASRDSDQMKKEDEAAVDKAKLDPTQGGGLRGREGTSLPRQSLRDLRPFPRNPDFVSQPVLSEELRQVIWERIMKDGQSVREVSAFFGIEMSRVGAVVRLMEIEKEWERTVGLPLSLMVSQFSIHYYDDLLKKSISL